MKGLLFGLMTLLSLSIYSSTNDVGVIGPNGEVMHFYKNGALIIMRACSKYTILGTSPGEARTSCQGRSIGFTVDNFNQALSKSITKEFRSLLAPLTPDEVDAYHSEGLSSEQIEALIAELSKINNFIVAYGTGNADGMRRHELVSALRSVESRKSAMERIKMLVEETVRLVVDEKFLKLTRFSPNQDQFLYNALRSLGRAFEACGIGIPEEDVLFKGMLFRCLE